MATQLLIKPVVRSPQPAMRTAAQQASQSVPFASAFSDPRAMGNQAYRTLATGQDRPTAAPGHAPAAPTLLPANARTGSAKLPPLSPEIREQMIGDVDRIVQILKSSFFTGEPDSGDQTRMLELIRKYERLDDENNYAGPSRTTPNLDHFLILLKSRAYSHSGIRSLFSGPVCDRI